MSRADIEKPDLILLGWRGQVRGSNMTGVAKAADRSVMVLKDNGLDGVRRILVPVGSGPHSRLGLSVAQQLAGSWGADITAMTVLKGEGHDKARDEFEHESLELFRTLAEDKVREALEQTGVTAEVKAVIGTDVAQAILDTAEGHELIIIGASDEWTVRQWLFGSLPDEVANNAEASVLMVRSGE